MGTEYIENRVIDGVMLGVFCGALSVLAGDWLVERFNMSIEVGHSALLLMCGLLVGCLLLTDIGLKIVFSGRHRTIFDGKRALYATLCGRAVGIVLGIAIAAAISDYRGA